MKLRKLFLTLGLVLSLTACGKVKEEPKVDPEPILVEVVNYTISWVVGDVTTTTTVEEGVLPVFDGTPTKEATAEFSYTFAGWEPEVVVATADATYTATFTETTNSYTVTFIDTEGEEISSESYAYGTLAADIVVPEKEVAEEDAENISFYYTTLDKDLVDVTEDVTYTVTFIASATKAGCLYVANELASAMGLTGTDKYWEQYGFCYAAGNFGSAYTMDQLMAFVPTAFMPEPYFACISDFEWNEDYAEYDATYVSEMFGTIVYVGVYNTGTEESPKNTIAFQVTPIVLG